MEGLKVRKHGDANALNYVELYLTNEFYQLVIDETACYAKQLFDDNQDKSFNNYISLYIPTDVAELKKVLGLVSLISTINNLTCICIGLKVSFSRHRFLIRW